MNNWQRFKEKIDVWIMRHSKEAVAGYWGINNIEKEEATRILAQLKVCVVSWRGRQYSAVMTQVIK